MKLKKRKSKEEQSPHITAEELREKAALRSAAGGFAIAKDYERAAAALEGMAKEARKKRA